MTQGWLGGGEWVEAEQREGEIVPVRIVALDQGDLPVSLPLFELLLARDRGFDVVVRLEPDQVFDRYRRVKPGTRPSRCS